MALGGPVPYSEPWLPRPQNGANCGTYIRALMVAHSSYSVTTDCEKHG